MAAFCPATLLALLTKALSNTVAFGSSERSTESVSPPLLPDGLYLMEIKIPGTAPLWLARLLADNQIFSTSFSKYGAYYKQYVLGGKSAVVKKEVLLSA